MAAFGPRAGGCRATYHIGSALRFLLELCALAALAVWGAHAGHGPATRAGLALAAPMLAAVVWGAFVAPRARWPVSPPLRLAIELAVFGAAFAGLQAARHPGPAWGFAAAVALDHLLLSVPPRSRPDGRP